MPYVVFGVSLLVTFICWRTALAAWQQKELDRFGVAVERTRNAIERRIQRQVELLRITSAMVETQERLSRDSFRGFYRSLDLHEYPGMLGLGFSIYVPPGEKAATLRRIRSEGRPDFRFFPESKEAHAILYLEPEDGDNLVALGYNMHSDPARAKAMDFARDWNLPAMTDTVRLVQDVKNPKSPGFLIYVPVYKGGDPGDVRLRRERLQGFVYSPFRAGDLLNSVLRSEDLLDVAVTVYDGPVAEPGRRFFTNIAARTGPFAKVITSEVPGHQWTIRYVALPAFEASSESLLVGWIPIIGLLVSLMLGGLSLAQARANSDLERNAEELHRRAYQQRLLAQAGALLGASLQVERTLTSVAQLAVPSFADWCAVDLLDPGGELRRVATVHIDPNKVRWARELDQRYPPDPSSERGVHAVVRTGKSEIYKEIPREMLVRGARDEEHLRIIDEIGLSSVIVVPLTARDQTVGAITFVWAESGFHYDDEDLKLAEEIGSRAGLAVDNARLYEAAQDELRVSSTLQRVGMRLAAELDQQRLAQFIADEATSLTRAAFGAFLYTMQQARGERLHGFAFSGGSRDGFERAGLFHEDNPLLSPAMREGQTVRIHHLEAGHADGISSFLAVPVVSRTGEILGALFFGHPDAGRFGEREELTLKGLAAYAAIALDNANLFTEKQNELEERRRAEERVRELNENLERLVKERTTELEASNHELEAFCYSVSHDLRGPLRSVDGFSKAVIEDYGEQLDDEALHYLDRVRAAARRMDELITALLSLSRLTRAEIHREYVDLTRIARESANDLLDSFRDSKVEVEVQPGLETEADPRMVRIVFDNLLGNAFKFSSRVEHPKIKVGREGDAFFVRDNGIGFNPEYYGKLFSPFERLHSGTDFPGSGIGLATVQRVVARHGGRVWAESEEGKGATFYFTLG